MSPAPRRRRRPSSLTGRLSRVVAATFITGAAVLYGPSVVTALEHARLPDCADVVAGMSARDRLAQRLMIGVDAADPVAAVVAVQAVQPGGIFLPGDATELLTGQALRDVQAAAHTALAVVVDDEGGRVQRIDALDGDLPSARAMAAQLTPQQVRDLAYHRGQALAARGVTMNLAPTVDIGGQPDQAVIGDRAFSEDPDQVAAYAAAFAQGQADADVVTVLKHFPGHGRADGDSHRRRVVAPPVDELRALDLRPYAALLGPGGELASGRTGVLVGHLDVPGLTTDLPSSLTPAVYQLLRIDYRFDGLVLTDDLGAMRAITNRFALPEAVEQALAAGADMALWSNPDATAGRVLDRLEEALTAGRIDPAANDTAVARVLRTKHVCS